MASTNRTGNLRLSQFEASDKPSWLSDYNNDMQAIDEAVAAASQQAGASMQKEVYDLEGKAQDVFAYAREGGIYGYIHEKIGTAHLLTGEGKHLVFTAVADHAESDQVAVNHREVELLDSDGKAAKAAWKAGDEVFLLHSGEQVRVLAPLANKADVEAVEKAWLQNHSCLWTPEIEYDLGDGLFGKRYAGAVTANGNSEHTVTFALATGEYRVVKAEGWFMAGGTNYPVVVNRTQIVSYYMRNTAGLIWRSIDNSPRTNAPYDIRFFYEKA